MPRTFVFVIYSNVVFFTWRLWDKASSDLGWLAAPAAAVIIYGCRRDASYNRENFDTSNFYPVPGRAIDRWYDWLWVCLLITTPSVLYSTQQQALHTLHCCPCCTGTLGDVHTSLCVQDLTQAKCALWHHSANRLMFSRYDVYHHHCRSPAC